MLPIIDTPVYKIKLLSIDEPVNFRPFDVKEEQILLLAMHEENIDRKVHSVFQVLNNCTFGKIDVEQLPSFDIEYLLLNVRAKSVGEIIECGIPCRACQKNNKISINIDDVILKTDEKNHQKKIMISDDVGVMMRYPSLKILENHDLGKMSEPELIAMSIDMVFDKDSVYKQNESNRQEFIEWVEKLTLSNFKKLVKFLETMPSLAYSVSFQCSECGENQSTTIRGLQNFFG